MEVLGATIKCNLSVSDHASNIFHALRILRAHDMTRGVSFPLRS